LARRYGTPAADIGNDIGNETRKAWLALAPSASDRAGTQRQGVQQLGQQAPKKSPRLRRGLGLLDDFTS